MRNPAEGWRAIAKFYQKAEQIDYSADCAISFFAGLQRNHPESVLPFLNEIIDRSNRPSSQLRAHAITGILAGMTTREEALAFIEWVHTYHLASEVMGFTDQVYPNLDPRELSLNFVITNCLSTLAKISPQASEDWIVQNKEYLPDSWAFAHLHRAAQNKAGHFQAAFEFIARSTSADDEILEDLFARHFHLEDERKAKLLALRRQKPR